jgi:hypothetical protein
VLEVFAVFLVFVVGAVTSTLKRASHHPCYGYRSFKSRDQPYQFIPFARTIPLGSCSDMLTCAAHSCNNCCHRRLLRELRSGSVMGS